MRSRLAAALLGHLGLWPCLVGQSQPPSTPRSDAAQAQAKAAPAELEFFERKVRPLLIARCGECHSAKTGPENGELVLDSPAGIRKGGSRGRIFVPKKLDESLVIRAIEYGNAELQMPPTGMLPATEIAVLRDWIERGAPLPDEGDPSAAAPARQIDIEAGRSFWSFRPLSVPPVPSGARSKWSRSFIDSHLAVRRAAAGLQPSPEADRRTLIRRVTFDVTGLPPSADEVDAFVADDRPDAYERLVERLLASPQVGEHMGRAWLDLARYTDTAAPWEKSTANAWLYRDWVVQAMNEDRPYDEFVRCQLAADLLPESPPEDLAALGFLGLGPTYWKELKLAPALIQTIVADEWDERIDAVSRTFLGLTVACARCHDHKFDPIAIEDYYALAGVFASSQLSDRPLLPEPQAAAVRTARSRIVQLETELKKIKEQNSEPARALKAQIEALRRETPGVDDPWAHVVEEASVFVVADGKDATRLDVRAGQPRDVPVFRRGSPTNPGEIVPRRFLAVLSTKPEPFRQGSGRRELAEAILNEARPLAARVVVNRVWAHHFGQGIVRTTSDFGAQGDAPTHPELLDTLAKALIDHGWSMKWLHRELVLSATYRQASARLHSSGDASTTIATRDPMAVDPDNRLLWRMNRRRLTVESWRDSLLAATGLLDERMGGPAAPIDSPQNIRRTLYGAVGRYEQAALLRLYDFPEPTAHSPTRLPTTTPLQQLFVLNSPFLRACAESLARRSTASADAPTRERIVSSYGWLFQRASLEPEIELGLRFLASCAECGLSREEGWTLYAQSLLGLNEMMFVD